MKSPGEPVGLGLCELAASETGLPFQLPVATSIVDAHAGGLGKFGAAAANVLLVVSFYVLLTRATLPIS